MTQQESQRIDHYYDRMREADKKLTKAIQEKQPSVRIRHYERLFHEIRNDYIYYRDVVASSV